MPFKTKFTHSLLVVSESVSVSQSPIVLDCEIYLIVCQEVRGAGPASAASGGEAGLWLRSVTTTKFFGKLISDKL